MNELIERINQLVDAVHEQEELITGLVAANQILSKVSTAHL